MPERQDSRVWTELIDDGGRRWQGVACLIRRVQRRFRRRQIGRHPASMCPGRPGLGHPYRGVPEAVWPHCTLRRHMP